jgi:hypothetical protein
VDKQERVISVALVLESTSDDADMMFDCLLGLFTGERSSARSSPLEAVSTSLVKLDLGLAARERAIFLLDLDELVETVFRFLRNVGA